MTSKIAFSQSAFEKLAPGTTPYIVWDRDFGRGAGSLGLKVYPDGEASVFVQTRVGGKQTKPTIVSKRPRTNLLSGEQGIDGLRQRARDVVKRLKDDGTVASVAKSRDARAEARRTASASAQMMTIDQVAEAYLEYRDAAKPLSAARRGEFERLVWGKLRNPKDRSEGRLGGADVVWKGRAVVELTDIEGQEFVTYLQRDTRTNANQNLMGGKGDQTVIAAKRMLNAMFRWFKTKHRISDVEWDHRIFPTGEGGVMPATPKAKDAVLSADEIERFLMACDEFAQEPSFGLHDSEEAALCLKLIYFTACRPQEAFTMRWHDFDLDAAKPFWRLAREHRKQRKVHQLELPRGAVEALRQLKEKRRPNDLGGYVFPARGKGPKGAGRKTGGGQHRGSIAGAFRSVLEIAGITRGKTQVNLSPGVLRPSRITYLIDSGLSVAEVVRLTGQDVQTVNRHYHRAAGKAEDVLALIDQIDSQAA